MDPKLEQNFYMEEKDEPTSLKVTGITKGMKQKVKERAKEEGYSTVAKALAPIVNAYGRGELTMKFEKKEAK